MSEAAFDAGAVGVEALTQRGGVGRAYRGFEQVLAAHACRVVGSMPQAGAGPAARHDQLQPAETGGPEEPVVVVRRVDQDVPAGSVRAAA